MIHLSSIFFGLGQQVLAPVADHADQPDPEAQGGQNEGNNVQENQGGQDGWPEWPDELLAQQQNEDQLVQLNLGVVVQQPVVAQLDLNVVPMAEDLQEMIIHLALDQDQVEELQLVPQPVQNQQQEHDQQPLVQVDLPVLNAPGENFLHHEILEDDLMDVEEINLQAALQNQENDNQQNVWLLQPVDNQLDAVQNMPDGQEKPVANFVAEVQEQPVDANEAVEAQGQGVEQIH